MGMTLSARARGASCEAKLDLDVLQLLEEQSSADDRLARALETIFGGVQTAFGVPREVRREELLDAVSQLLSVEDRLRAATYSIVFSIAPGRLPPSSASGIGGARVDDVLFNITCGVNQCTLERYLQDNEGKWNLIAREDIRSLKTIETDNMGVIRIRRRPKPPLLRRLLRDLQRFLTEIPADEDVTLIIG